MRNVDRRTKSRPDRRVDIRARAVPDHHRARGVELRLIIEGDRPQAPGVDRTLLTALARAHRWFADLAAGRAPSLAALAAQEGNSVRYVGRLIRLAFLAPAIVEAIVAGRQPPQLTAEVLTRRTRLPYVWDEQQRMLSITPLMG